MSTILKNNSETDAQAPGRASSIGVWIVQVVLTGAVITDQFVLEQSPWLPLALLVVAAVIARARWSRTEAVVGTLLRR